MKKKIILACLAVITIILAAVCFFGCYEGIPYPFEKPTYTKSIDGISYSGNTVKCCEEDATEVIIADSVTYRTKLNSNYISGCSTIDVKTFTIDVISENAFRGLENLERIVIPKTVTKIEDGAFIGCTNLRSIEISPDNPVYKSVGNYISLKEDSQTLILGCEATVIPEDGSITKIGEEAFNGCDLESFYIPSAITEIAKNAFNGCDKLESFTVNENNSEFFSFDGILYDKKKTEIFLLPSILKGKVEIYNGTKIIPSYTFQGRKQITEIIIPNSVESIGEGALSMCSGLEKLTAPFRIKDEYGYIDHQYFGYLFDEDKSWKGEYINQTGLIEVRQYDTIDERSYIKFYLPANLSSVTINGGEIKNCAFTGCYRLQSVSLESGVVIGREAFYKCENLTEINLPDGVIVIGKDAFYDSAYYKDKNNWENGELYIGKHLIKCNYGSAQGYTVKSGTLTIADWAFCGKEKLKFLFIPSSVKRIENYVLEYFNRTEIFYEGTADEFTEICVGDKDFTNLKIYYYSPTKPENDGLFWRYVDGEVTVWEKD